MNTTFIDTHCHYCDEAFAAGEAEEAIGRALGAGVAKMIQADIDSRERPAMLALCDSHPGVLYPMAGLYPGSVDRGWQEEVDRVCDVLRERKDIVAVGEIGLDCHYGREYIAEQKDALRAQLEIASRLGLPVNIHLRDATEDFFDVLEGCRALALRGNLHAFSGSAETFRRLSRYGDWYVGIGGVVTFRGAGIARELADIPVERILLETDAPYLAPTPLRGTRNESANIPIIAAKVAEIKGMDIESTAQVTTANALTLFPAINQQI